ncbi:hypothetical protein MKJ01_15695 [Chryseobacterium sp. SSA4.19]|uniref:hypothetical protein n=1 Tax=Chryseobacterium sp. SSA4.19 TaxID=2919915 RepID=UPI001F4E551F|nr:hypothetical protein [Chryseobacterium sp. SSA4.19]MCJ8155209.1 hypothetical protein [Chryseobacterium sp. SSA4.19]
MGNIEFDNKQDDPHFKKCSNNERRVFQYYNDSKGFQFEGEKIRIENGIQALNLSEDKNSNGYITIRFVVNCEGRTGMFRVQQMDENYIAKKFNQKIVNQLLLFTKDLEGWVPKKIEKEKVDYYQYVTYKIENGKVSEILP